MSDPEKPPLSPSKRDDEKKKAASPSTPAFRFAAMKCDDDFDPTLDVTRSAKLMKPMLEPFSDSDMIIDPNDFQPRDVLSQKQPSLKPPPAPAGPAPGSWSPKQLRPVPAFYPLEKSTRLVEFDTPASVAERLSDRLRTLSVFALYDNEAATASLLTAENVEMHLSLWQTPVHSSQQGVLVELQRRKGDSMAYHRYSRYILDAAVGDESAMSAYGLHASKNSSQHNFDDDNILYSKKVQRLISMELSNQANEEHENAIVAIEIAHGLLMKDRMDARQLGLESLCLLTDPSKTGAITATLTAHVVLLGSTQGVHIPGVETTQEAADTAGGALDKNLIMTEGPFQEIRETILGLVQFSRIGEDQDEDDEFGGDDIGFADPLQMQSSSIDKEQMTLLHNLALAVLANALDAIEKAENFDFDDDEPEATPRTRVRTASSTDVAEEFMTQTKERSSKDILATLISELGTATHKPHNATLSAKCIGSLCRASEKAKRRAKELGAKQVVATALEVGEKTHLRLETECKKVSTALETPSSAATTRRSEQQQDDNEEEQQDE